MRACVCVGEWLRAAPINWVTFVKFNWERDNGGERYYLFKTLEGFGSRKQLTSR